MLSSISYLSLLLGISSVESYTTAPPPISPATGLKNKVYRWRNQNIRYQETGDPNSDKCCVLVHGLFVNSDHWRKTLDFLSSQGYRAYALDLLGCGYSSKPPRDSIDAIQLCGERKRFDNNDIGKSSGIVENVMLGTANGKTRVSDVELRHPIKSPYNFFTWSDQIVDFTNDVVLSEGNSDTAKATIVCNSIGTISSFQSALNEPHLFDGVFVVSPNFRELHISEIPFPKLSMPLLKSVQSLLRTKGYGLFKALAKPDTVRQILKEPYFVEEAVDDTLVDVLLDPLLTDGAADVVFDTLSYSAGPLPEQQLQDPNFSVPVWVCYGTEDPWTPSKRVEKLVNFNSLVERVVALEGAGHCPHDETPDLVNTLLSEFLQKIKK